MLVEFDELGTYNLVHRETYNQVDIDGFITPHLSPVLVFFLFIFYNLSTLCGLFKDRKYFHIVRFFFT